MGFIKKIKISGAIALIIAVSLLMLTSCDLKTEPQPQPEKIITQSFSLAPIVEQSQLKSFDPNTWVYDYSDVQYNLVLSNAHNTYSVPCSVDELLAGTVSITVFAGTYDVSYVPTHATKYDDNLDIRIEMQDLSVQGTPITLQGILDDALIIFDTPAIKNIATVEGNTDGFAQLHQDNFFNWDTRGFWYAYTNQSFTNMQLWVSDSDFTQISLSVETGNVYWYRGNIGAALNLNIPLMAIQQIPL